MELFAGRSRVVIESVQPELDGGRFPIKRIVGEPVSVVADCFCDGHDLVRGVLLFRHNSDATWSESELAPLRNDRFQAEFVVHRIGLYAYTIQAWIDRFGLWHRDMQKRTASDLDIELHLRVGIDMVSEALPGASRDDRAWLEMQIDQMQGHRPIEERLRTACHATLADRMRSITPREFSSQYERELSVVVDRQRARFSTWYELFPRSCGNERVSDGTLVHGTFADVESQLPRIAKMGFDVLYLPPIHPIGLAFRKGKNNSTTATESDVGSPWGIIVVVNLDPRHSQSGWIELDEFGIRDSDRYHLIDLFGGGNYVWQGHRNFVMLDPKISPAHVFLVRHHLRTEKDFDYFL